MIGFGHDEEIGGANGAKKIAGLLRDRGVRLDWLLDEGSVIADGIVPGVDWPLALKGVAEKSYVTVEIIATAPGGHASMPPYETVVTELARAISRVQENPFAVEMTSWGGPVDSSAEPTARRCGPDI